MVTVMLMVMVIDKCGDHGNGSFNGDGGFANGDVGDGVCDDDGS